MSRTDGLTDEQAKEYFERSYRAADGLWFMKVEERYGLESALEIDDEVWKVLPKIQARMIRSMLGAEESLEGLARCISTRLDLEGFEFQAQGHEDALEILIKRCPWHDLMVKSGREHLSQKISSLICTEENSVWASQFGEISFEPVDQICRGSDGCKLRFVRGSKV
jgi:hypothetical protein